MNSQYCRSLVASSVAFFCVVIAILTNLNSGDARAVNISNTWILPEEGYPVFYRYFRDRISWYEADAVCQFHHANLVTVDTTAQYDAARAYLKELDIMSNVWIGLIKSNEDGDFAWTDYKALSGEGYWASSPVEGRAPLCAALDPAKDYRWGALSCGGPQVASFICELPVPAWALSSDGGCLLKSLPSLTVQFLPELAAVQLISDCGLDGTKKVTCKSNETHTDVLKELSCGIIEDDFSENTVTGSTSVEANSGSPRASPSGPWAWSHTSDSTPSTTTVAGDYSTRTRRETVPPSTSHTTTTATPGSNSATNKEINENKLPQMKPRVIIAASEITSKPPISTTHHFITDESSVSENPSKISVTPTTLPKETTTQILTTSKNIPTNKDITSPMNSQNTDIEHKPKEKEHHDIFTLATDHFIPPLVMAKSRLSADMTVVSPETKHLQNKHNHQQYLPAQKSEQSETTKVPVLATSEKPKPMDESPKNIVITTEIHNSTSIITPKPKPLIVKPLNTDITTSTVTSTQINIDVKSTEASTPMKSEENIIEDKIKFRKPGKGKKYDKYKEEKKKYKEVTTESSNQQMTHKIVAVTIPSVTGSSSPMAVLEITTKILEKPLPVQPIQTKSQQITETSQIVTTEKSKIVTTEKSQIVTTEKSEIVITEKPQIVTTQKLPIVTEKSEITTTDKSQIITTTNKDSIVTPPIPQKLSENPMIVGTPTVSVAAVNTTHPQDLKILIDPHIMKLNTNVQINNDSESIEQPKYNKTTQELNITLQLKENNTLRVIPRVNSEKIVPTVEVPTTKNSVVEKNISDKSDETTEPTPDPLPRPNRSRTLTQPPQHRSFYPYFFNRVLG